MNRRAVPGIPFVFSLGLSACTVGSHVYWQDSGFYLTAVRDLTVLYPHGFVLYLLLCKAWTLAAAPLFGFTLAVHLFSSLMAAAGASFAALAARDFLRRLAPGKPSEWPAIGSGCLLAAGYCYGHAAILAKTYALSYALLALLLWLLVRAERKRDFLAMGAVLGLSWAAHPSAALLVPGLLVYGWVRRDRLREWGWGFFGGVVALAAACAFLPCLVLPVLAARESLSDFGNPRTFRELIEFVSGERFTGQSQAFGFSAWRAVAVLRYAAEEYLGGAFPLALGTWILLRRHLPFAILLSGWIVPFLLVTLLFKAEGQFDQWLVFSYLPMTLLVAVGLAALEDRSRRIALGVIAAAALTMAAVNVPLLSQRNYLLAEQYGRLLMKNLDPGSVLFLYRDDSIGICRYLQGIPGERGDVLPLSSSFLGQDWLDQRLARQRGFAVPVYGRLRRPGSGDSWEMVAVAAFANENFGKGPALFSDIRPSREILREDLDAVPAGMLWKIVARGKEAVDLRYWDYPLRPEDIPRKGRARGHWGYLTPEGVEMQLELYEDRFFLPLLWARVRLGDLRLPQEPARALEDYESVRSAYPEAVRDPRFAYHLGLAFYRMGRRGEAARVWEELLGAKPPGEIAVFVQFYLGELQREAGRPDLAIPYYRSALSSSPSPELRQAIQERLAGR